MTDGFETVTDPQDTVASPSGWHSTGSTTTTTTAGNNVVAYKGSQSKTASQSSSGLNFIYTQNPANAPTTSANLNAAITNAFYIVNSVHDLSYRYVGHFTSCLRYEGADLRQQGFTESAFNFQTNNFGKGGAGSDRVTVSVQDSAGTDNADFSTPAE